VRRLLDRYGYPPDGQDRALGLVTDQEELYATVA